jgi:glycosyltransferase 2 family protein
MLGRMQHELTLRRATPAFRLRRGHVSTLIWVAMGAAAVYLLLPQIGELQESLASLEHVEPGWLALGALLVVLRYALAALSLQAAAGRPVPFGPTLLVQASSAFIGRFTPEGVGWLGSTSATSKRRG